MQLDLSGLLALADRPDQMLDYVFRRLLGDGDYPALRKEISQTLNGITIPVADKSGPHLREAELARRTRMRMVMLMTLAAPRIHRSALRQTHVSKNPSNHSRRHFLRHAGSVAALGAGAPLATNLGLIGQAAAQSAGDYKALVCVFMRGGNDAFDTVLATDTPSWSNYLAVRGLGGSAIALRSPGTPKLASGSPGSPDRLGGAIAIAPANPQGRKFALHPELAPLKDLFDTHKRLAIVSNVGPLIAPTTKADLLRPGHPRPPKLFSHNDQQSVWQAMAPEGARQGWGGRLGDMFAAGNGHPMFTSMTTGVRSIWGTGASVLPLSISESGVVAFGNDPDGSIYGSPELALALQRVATIPRSTNPLEVAHTQVVKRSLAGGALLRSMLPAASDSRWSGSGTAGSGNSLQYVSPVGGKAIPNPLAAQLQTVIRVIAAANGGGLSARRQIFFVGIDGFDTHNDQSTDHAELMAQLAQGLLYFDTTMGSLGLRQNVTLFTASEFGRTFTSNGDGTDHGWGGHQFVLGEAVRGGDIYGRFPTYGAKNLRGNGFDSSDDQVQNGVLLPSQSVDQMAATLGRWLGASPSQLAQALPNLANFGTLDLGFLL